MLMSFWDPKEPQCHGLRLFGNLGVYQGIVSSFGLLYFGGWELETGCTLLILMLATSSIRIMKKVIVTFSLLVVGHPFYGRIKSWLRLCKGMTTISNVVRGLYLKGKNAVVGMKRVSLSIVIYLIWEERNRKVFENFCILVESLFWRFQVLFYMILHFHERNHL